MVLELGTGTVTGGTNNNFNYQSNGLYYRNTNGVVETNMSAAQIAAAEAQIGQKFPTGTAGGTGTGGTGGTGQELEVTGGGGTGILLSLQAPTQLHLLSEPQIQVLDQEQVQNIG